MKTKKTVHKKLTDHQLKKIKGGKLVCTKSELICAKRGSPGHDTCGIKRSVEVCHPDLENNLTVNISTKQKKQ